MKDFFLKDNASQRQTFEGSIIGKLSHKLDNVSIKRRIICEYCKRALNMVSGSRLKFLIIPLIVSNKNYKYEQNGCLPEEYDHLEVKNC